MATRTVSALVFRVLVGSVLISGVWALKTTYDRGQLKGGVAELRQEQTRLTETIQTQADTLKDFEGELVELQATLTEREREIAQLEMERTNLLASNTSLTQRLALLQQERAALEAKLASLNELKAAIRVVTQKIRTEQRERWLASIRQRREHEAQQLAGGNRGYVVRQGLSTLGARTSAGTRLQVRVLDPEAP